MALLKKKDVDILLKAGFDESELGMAEGGKLGIEVFQSPENYFAHEAIENACECGECDLYDEIVPAGPKKEPYDTSRKRIWDDQEYAGNEDPMEGIEQNLREQIKFLLGIKIGRLSIWQSRNERGQYRFPVKRINIVIPENEKERMVLLDPTGQKELWVKYAKEEWKKCWQACIDSIWSTPIEETITFKTSKGKELNMLAISADAVKRTGYKNLPNEARWITLIYFEKDKKR